MLVNEVMNEDTFFSAKNCTSEAIILLISFESYNSILDENL